MKMHKIAKRIVSIINGRNINKANIDFINKYIYVHIPKTAGTSITKALGFEQTYHTKLFELRNFISLKEYKKFYKFTFVRHPYDRFLSLYYYAIAAESYYHSALNPSGAINGKHPNYDALKNKSLYDCAKLLIEGKLKIPNYYYIWAPQSDWLLNKKGEIEFEFIGRYENLEEDFHKVLQELQLPLTSLGKFNQSLNTNNIESLQDKTKSILYQYYRSDFEILRYQR